VVTVLPLEVVRSDDLGPGATALREARVRVHLTGRGPRILLDGRELRARPERPAELAHLLDRVARGFPRERVVGLTLGRDVLYQQLLELVRTLVGGPTRRYSAVSWLVDETHTATATGAADATLAVREALFVERPVADLVQPFPLRERDQARLESLAKAMSRCLPELEARLPRTIRVEVTLTFEEGRLSRIEPARPAGLRRAHVDALRGCVHDIAHGFRLREHRDTISVTVRLGARR
jgi:hypothetical protein